jgi:carboxymethylenebutenolidase
VLCSRHESAYSARHPNQRCFPQVKAHAQKLAASGYRVLIPDLYKGKVGVDKEEASHLMGHLDWMAAIAEIKEAAKYLKTAEGCRKVGITGFCMGGALALAGLAHSEDIVAAAPFYGLPKPQLADLSTVRKPVQGHYGAEDKMKGFSDPEAARATEATLKKAGAEAEFFVYPGVGHAFMNDNPAPYNSFEEREAAMGFPAYDETQAALAWERLQAFFAKHLKA